MGKRSTDPILKALRAFGLSYPGAHLKSPWPGHLDLAVNDKTFAYLSVEGEPFAISCKLPVSGMAALLLTFTEPTPYGLGKSGWVTARYEGGARPDPRMLRDWIDESYRAQAPRRLLAQLEARSGAGARPPAARARAGGAAAARRRTPARARRP